MDHYLDAPDTHQPYSITLDNSGHVPLQVPGFGEIPIHFVLLSYEVRAWNTGVAIGPCRYRS
jgi:hypothetical protein